MAVVRRGGATEPWQRWWTGLGVPETVAGLAWRPFMLRYATALAPLPAELHAATEARSFAELTRAAAAAGVAVQCLRGHAQRCHELSGSAPFAAPWTVEPIGPQYRETQGPGPLVGYLLGLLGAEVISIEPTGGDALRAATGDRPGGPNSAFSGCRCLQPTATSCSPGPPHHTRSPPRSGSATWRTC